MDESSSKSIGEIIDAAISGGAEKSSVSINIKCYRAGEMSVTTAKIEYGPDKNRVRSE